MSQQLDVKTWRERIGVSAEFPLHAPTDVERSMEAEIAELRALLDRQIQGRRLPPPQIAWEFLPGWTPEMQKAMQKNVGADPVLEKNVEKNEGPQ